MSGVTDVSLLLPLTAALVALVLTGLWLIAMVSRAKRTGGRAVPSGLGGLEMAAIILLLLGGFFLLVGWVVGAVLLWISPRWGVADKLLGTLVWPGGLSVIFYAAPIATTSETCSGGSNIPTRCTWTGPPLWLGTAILVIILVGQVATTAWLLLRARRGPGPDTASPAPTA